MPSPVDVAIALLASSQHGVFTRQQAIALGASRAMIQRRRATGRWTVEAAGVYGLPGAVHTWHRRLMVAHLDLGARSVVSHRSAAALLAFPGARQGPPELTVPRGGTRSRRWRVHESEVPDTDRTRAQGIPATTVVRTVVDLAAVFDQRALCRLVDGLLADGRVQLGPLTTRALARRSRGRPGSGHLADVLDALGPGHVPAASELEALLFAVLAAGGLPQPVRQHPLPSLTQLGRVDAAYPAARLILEVDGRRWHTKVDDFERDRKRDIEAGLLGWTVLRFVWADLIERPEWVCHVVRHHLRLAA